jgi:hygromycin-B 7''-O-kinase
MTTDVYLQPNAPDPVLTADRVLSLVRRHTSASEVRRVEESGGEARAYLVDDGMVLKVQRPHRLRPRTSLEKEALLLTQMASYPDIPTPKLIGYGREEDIEYICMTRMPGLASNGVELSDKQRRSLLVELGITLRMLHQIDQAPLRNSNLVPGDYSLDDLLSRIDQMLNQAAEAVSNGQRRWTLPIPLDELASRITGAIRAPVALVTLHSNPGPEHVFIDPTTKELSGLIDFGDAYVSHPGFDVRWPLLADRVAILEGYQQAGELDGDFLSTWHAIQVARDVSTVFSLRSNQDQRAQALRNLEEQIGDSRLLT